MGGQVLLQSFWTEHLNLPKSRREQGKSGGIKFSGSFRAQVGLGGDASMRARNEAPETLCYLKYCGNY